MSKSIELYNKTSNGRTKTWKCWTDGDTLWKEWWIENGKHQKTPDKVQGKNIGKSNETSPEEQCIFEWERAVRLKKEENYSNLILVCHFNNLYSDYYFRRKFIYNKFKIYIFSISKIDYRKQLSYWKNTYFDLTNYNTEMIIEEIEFLQEYSNIILIDLSNDLSEYSKVFKPWFICNVNNIH